MFCQNCGAQISDTDMFCSVCGKATAASESQTAAQSQQPETQQQQSYAPPAYSQFQQQSSQYGDNYSQQPVYFDCGIRTRDIALAIILSIVTCGIYNIIWFIKQVDDVNRAANDQGALSGGVTWLLMLVTGGIYGCFWYYQAGKKMTYAKQVRNMRTDSGTEILYLVLSIFGFGIINMCLIQSDLNKMATSAA